MQSSNLVRTFRASTLAALFISGIGLFHLRLLWQQICLTVQIIFIKVSK
jgi:hypothetical protein